jgi:hypothetical protein
MYEVPEPPKKGNPYPWIAVVLSVLSVSLLLVTLTGGSMPTSNADALAVSQTAAAYRERLMQARVEALATEVEALRARQVSLEAISKDAAVLQRKAEADLAASALALREANVKADQLKERLRSSEAELARLRDAKKDSSAPPPNYRVL